LKKPLMETNIQEYPCQRGKVRDIYDLGKTLAVLATDRISAFDVVMANGIPDKGRVLTGITKFWLDNLSLASPNHCLSTELRDFPLVFQKPEFEGRIMLCQKAEVSPVECVVRGYITGGGWKDYQKTGEICGLKLPTGLEECEKLPEPIFTPSTKARKGHDENISFKEVCEIVGKKTAEQLRDWSLWLYVAAHQAALKKGVIIADTKFEFGSINGRVILIDEVLTPDSSRFWPKNFYIPGCSQPSYDKQFVRDYLQGLCDEGKWDKTPPGPRLPEDVVDETFQKYLTLYRLLIGKELAA